MRLGRMGVLAVVFAAPAAAGACGSRTGLLVESLPGDAEADQVAGDTSLPGEDAEFPDSGDEPFEVGPGRDALPPIDASFPDAPGPCPDAGSTLVYVLTAQNDLYSFYPPTLAFSLIGRIACPSGSSPFSMAVDREGIAYSVFENGSLFKLDTKTAACAATSFAPDQHQFLTFGMGYVANTGGDAGETLYVAQDTASASRPTSQGLASVDTTTMQLGFVAGFSPPIAGPELTGTADGRLFGFFTNAGSGSHVVEIDRTTGRIVGDSALAIGNPNDAFAFAFWGGDFWIFTGTTSSTVTRFDPGTGVETNVTTLSDTIVGAGVSTCAPE